MECGLDDDQLDHWGLITVDYRNRGVYVENESRLFPQFMGERSGVRSVVTRNPLPPCSRTHCQALQ